VLFVSAVERLDRRCSKAVENEFTAQFRNHAKVVRRRLAWSRAALGDDRNAGRDINLAVSHLTEAATAFLELAQCGGA
jgi:hypothetical protein